jgi:hypothetical protein
MPSYEFDSGVRADSYRVTKGYRREGPQNPAPNEERSADPANVFASIIQ